MSRSNTALDQRDLEKHGVAVHHFRPGNRVIQRWSLLLPGNSAGADGDGNDTGGYKPILNIQILFLKKHFSSNLEILFSILAVHFLSFIIVV